jgi:hypothetical protein
MGPDSIFRHPKKQIYLVTAVFLVWYFILVNKTGGIHIRDFLFAIVAAMVWVYNLVGIMNADPSAYMPPSISALSRDLLLFGFVFVVGLGFFAQFVLPLHTVPERWSAFTRLVLYGVRRHGPAISIRDGVEKYHSGEKERRGPGVILLDTASAAVLRIPARFTRAVGPGIVFTGRRETIANAFPLHRQFKQLGPMGKEDPFAPRSEETETEAQFQARRTRRFETSGTTRDGVEVVPTIATIFQLSSQPATESDPERVQTPVYTKFGFNPNTIWKANGREGIDPKRGNDTEQRKVRWDWLPAYMAAELWREYLEKYTLNELFANPGEVVEETALQRIERFMNARLKTARVDHLDEFGKTSGRGKVVSPEYMRLQERGLEVITTFVSAVRFPEDVERKFLEQWQDRWKDQAGDELLLALQKKSERKIEGQELALRQFAEAATSKLGAHLLELLEDPRRDYQPDEAKTLELLVQGTINQTVEDKYLRPQITSQRQEMFDLIEWIRRNQ